MARNNRSLEPSNLEAADIETLEQDDPATGGEEEEPEPFFHWIKRIIEAMVIAFEKRHVDLLPSIPDFIRMVQMYREIGETDEPSQVEIIWKDPFAPKS